MKPRLINANALMEYCQNQRDRKIDCNDIARFPTYPTDEWHDLRKNPNDLPKEDLRQRTYGYYLTASKHKSYKGFVFEVAYFTGVVFIKGGDILDNVIAWKEIVLTELPKEE